MADLATDVVKVDPVVRLREHVAARYETDDAAVIARALAFMLAAQEAAGHAGAHEPAMQAAAQALVRACDVAEILIDLDVDPATVAAALIEARANGKPARGSAALDLDAVKDAFGLDVVELLKGLKRAGQIESLTAKQSGNDAAGIETMRKMLLAMADDVRVVLIKLAERVVYMRGLTKLDNAVHRTTLQAAAQQTRSLFAPLANRLGVFSIKWELEDLSFRFVEPELYKRIATMLDGKRAEREAYITRVLDTLRAELKRLNIKAEIAGRPKHIWSIHRKMQAKNLAFDELYDIRAVRVLVDNVADCYAVLALAHDLWKAVPGEFDDYIAQPKANNYQSLHTAVVGPEEKTLEVQIRTHEMHAASEHGVAAHWRYKEGGAHKTAADKRFESKISWLRQVLDWKRELADEGGFSEQVKQGLFNDTIYVFTPQGKVIDLVAGATPVDFAYHVHTDLGHRCRGAKIDGAIVPLNTKLQNAQRVEILAAKQGGPSRDWVNPQLGYMASPRAMAKVRNWFRQEYFEVDVAHGRQTLERELARAGQTALALERVSTYLGHKSLDEFLAEVGRGEITAHQIEVALREIVAGMANAVNAKADSTTDAAALAAGVLSPSHAAKSSSGVLMLGVNNIATLVAKCCKPVPPDAIIGFVTKTRGVMVHRQDCVNVTGLAPDQRERLMAAQWGDTGSQPFAADIEVTAADRQGLLRDISEALTRERINVTAVNTLSRNNVASMRFTVEITRADQLQRVVRAVSEVSGVERVIRR
jgi:GTP pyrophosphokinase